jgi:cell division topological specificity factor
MLFGESNESKDVAKSRLHFVLVQDRTGLTNDEMAGFREEMVKVIEKYFVIDKEGFDIKYHRLADTTTLLINSPVIVRRAGSASRAAANQVDNAVTANI